MSVTADPSQVLEFDLGPNRYCVDIEYVSQIVDHQSVTDLPNAPAHVAGVTDLRGRTTTVVDPGELFDIDGSSEADHILVFDPDAIDADSTVGWEIDAVHRVVDVAAAEVDETSMSDTEGIEGLISRDDGFVIWVTPENYAS